MYLIPNYGYGGLEYYSMYYDTAAKQIAENFAKDMGGNVVEDSDDSKPFPLLAGVEEWDRKEIGCYCVNDSDGRLRIAVGWYRRRADYDENDNPIERYILQKSESENDGWVLTDLKSMAVCRFREHQFASTRRTTILDGSNLDTIESEKLMEEWLRANHPEIV